MAKIDFFQIFLNSKKGELFGYPVDETAIRAFNIQDYEIEPFMNDSKYYDKPWGDILKEILDNRKRQESQLV